MILNIQQARGSQPQPIPNLSLPQQFFMQLCTRNNNVLKAQKQQAIDNERETQRRWGQGVEELGRLCGTFGDGAGGFGVEVDREWGRDCGAIIRGGQEEMLEVGQNVCGHEQLYNQYNNFVPINYRLYKDKNEWEREFDYFNYLHQNNFDYQITKYQQFINKGLSNKKNLTQFRQQLYQTYNPMLTFLQKLQLYTKLLSQGTKSLRNFANPQAMMYILSISSHKNYLSGYDCFSQLSVAVSSTANNMANVNRNISVSLGRNQEITTWNVGYTMKVLYCAVCFVYDCRVHDRLELTKGVAGTVNFVSPKNKISKKQHISSLITMLHPMPQIISQPCSSYCYLNKQKLSKTINLQYFFIGQHKSMSDLKKCIIHLGVYLFSYNPCKIRKLFPEGQTSCYLIYMYLISQFGAERRLEVKMCSDEVQMLRNQVALKDGNQVFVLEGKKKHKKKAHKSLNKSQNQSDNISICLHHFLNQQSVDLSCKNCICRKRGYCTYACLCSQYCTIIKKGCGCKKLKLCCSGNHCPCYKNKQQCIPQICGKNCSQRDSCCMNQQIQKRSGNKKKLRIGVSKIKGAGLGLFTMQNIQKQSLVTLYLSQQVNQFIIQTRDQTRKTNSFYNFQIQHKYLDSKYLGNEARFINHNQPRFVNLQVRIMRSLDEKWVAFYATRDIEAFEELYFDYDGDGQLARDHADKYPFVVRK